MSKESDFQEILENGINFGRGGGPRKEDDKVKTKAKKKKYITGAHGSGSAKQKAKYREQRHEETTIYVIVRHSGDNDGCLWWR